MRRHDQLLSPTVNNDSLSAKHLNDLEQTSRDLSKGKIKFHEDPRLHEYQSEGAALHDYLAQNPHEEVEAKKQHEETTVTMSLGGSLGDESSDDVDEPTTPREDSTIKSNTPLGGLSAASIPQYMMYTPNCTASIPQYMMYTPNCTASIPQYMMYTPNCTASIPQYMMYTPNCTASIPQYMMYTPNCTASIPNKGINKDEDGELTNYRSKYQTEDFQFGMSFSEPEPEPKKEEVEIEDYENRDIQPADDDAITTKYSA
ncbi:unnamed protein product [Mytilus edulis]|uniref:Uncharacterized protein n=1 Tax=Mytilus edulis TaxID=6550 RepID=A0A8S3Q1Z6_MYTED|nr:unnamed protein product [Mytilus edulis]